MRRPARRLACWSDNVILTRQPCIARRAQQSVYKPDTCNSLVQYTFVPSRYFSVFCAIEIFFSLLCHRDTFQSFVPSRYFSVFCAIEILVPSRYTIAIKMLQSLEEEREFERLFGSSTGKSKSNVDLLLCMYSFRSDVTAACNISYNYASLSAASSPCWQNSLDPAQPMPPMPPPDGHGSREPVIDLTSSPPR